ncbi:unnamed protein product, partial [Porites lobata]
MAKLKDSIGHDFEFSQDMDDLFVADDVFSGLDSEREQRSFFLENFNLKDALIILGYFDDLEIANPLGSKAKVHKIGVFYYVLANIHPM